MKGIRFTVYASANIRIPSGIGNSLSSGARRNETQDVGCGRYA